MKESESTVIKELHDALEVENCHLYEAFNEELDRMYNDVQLPPGEAIGQLVNDLKRTAEEKGRLVTELGSVISYHTFFSFLVFFGGRFGGSARRWLIIIFIFIFCFAWRLF